MEPERRLQIRAGAFTLVVLVTLGAVVASLTREAGLFTPRYTLYAEFNNIEGLLPNSRVLLAGNDVGRVRDIYFLEPGADKAIRVELDLDAGVQDRIRRESVASVYPVGVLGDVYVGVSLGRDGPPVPDRGMLDTVEPFSWTSIYDQGNELLGNLVEVSASVERVVGDFEESMGSESLASTLGSLRNVVREIETGGGLLHQLIYERSDGAPAEIEAALVELRGSAARLSAILAEIEEGDGLLHGLIYGSEGDEAATLAAVRQSAERLESVLRKLDEGEGSLGALLNDPALYEETKLLISGTRESALLRTLIDYLRPEADARP